MIGDIFLEGSLTDQDPALALSLFEKGAKLGSRRCSARAAEVKHQREVDYFEGISIEKTSRIDAFPYFEKSMRSGYLPAHVKIAPYYEYGVGTKKNRKLAFYHYKTAVDIGDKRALFDLGRCYSNGIGTRFNFKKASKYLSMARELGQRGANDELFRIYENKKKHMTRSLYSTAMSLLYKKNYGESMRLLEFCSSLKYSAATYTLGCLYEFGIGVPANRRTALDYYKLAYSLGYSDYDQSHKYKMLKMTK
jgi:TPR repeat protein